MSSLLNRFALWQKFALLGAIAAILVSLPLGMYISEARKAIVAAEAEVQGLPPVRSVMGVVLLVQQHRGMSAMVLSGNDAAQVQRAAKQTEVDRAITAANAALVQVANPAASTQWKEAKDRWAVLPAKVAERQLTAPESFAAHTALVEQMLKVNELLIDHFGLSLDPEADSYYLIDAALVQSPDLIESLGRLRARGSGILTAKTASLDDRAAIVALIEKAKGRFAAVRSAVDKAVAANPALNARLAGPLQATLAKGEDVLRLAHEEIAKPEQHSYNAPDYFNKVTAAIGEQVQFQEAALKELEGILAAREAKLAKTSYALIGAILALVLLGWCFGMKIIRSITGPLHEAIDIAERVAAGDLSTHIEVRYRNETGKLLQALKDMNAGLSQIVSEVRNGTETIATATSEIATGNLDLSSRTEHEASSLEETASTMEELTSTVRQNADNARQANQLALSASTVASRGGEMVQHVVETMNSINDSSRKIVDIISVIDGIAFQTNILALTPPWKQPAQASKAADLPSLPPRCAASPSDRPPLPRKSRN
jgi:methyl-accepting chemotaxis protein